jgi:hypothetical protein
MAIPDNVKIQAYTAKLSLRLKLSLMCTQVHTQMRTWLKSIKKWAVNTKTKVELWKKVESQYPRATKVCLSYLKMYAMKWVL